MPKRKKSASRAKTSSRKRIGKTPKSSHDSRRYDPDRLDALRLVHDEAREFCECQYDTETQYSVPSIAPLHAVVVELRKHYRSEKNPDGKLPFPVAGYWTQAHRRAKKSDDGCYPYVENIVEWAAAEIRGGEAVHSEDFRWVRWLGVEYKFADLQAKAVEVLWAYWQKGRKEIHQKEVLDRIRSPQGQLRELFRTSKGKGKGKVLHPAWDTMIKSDGKGYFWLDDPLEE